jgi:alginate O-acetyltransferase complex protein AlgI
LNVPSFEFLGFALAVALVVNISAKTVWRRYTFATANVLFLLTFTRDPKQLMPFVALLAAGYVAMKLLETAKQRSAAFVSIGGLILAFCWLKRYAFIPSATFLTDAYLTVGMSYVFFRVLHLVIDSYSDALPTRIGPVEYISYALNFASLVSGPIQLYQDYYRTAALEPAPLTRASVGVAVERIIEGLFKVEVASPVLYAAFGQARAAIVPGMDPYHRTLYAAATIVCFPLYLYINFSGYMDFVIGVARFLRLELPENFNQPFKAESFLDFWSRWHMTLSGWLKRYVYTSLAMALLRRFPSPQVEPYIAVAAYFVTFFLIGLWHGQTSMFIVYGLLQGAGVTVNKVYSLLMIARLGRKRYRALCAKRVYSSFSRGVTFTYFAVTLVWFWALGSDLRSLARTVGLLGISSALLVVAIGASVVLTMLYGVENALIARKSAGRFLAEDIYIRTAWTTALLVLTLSTVLVLNAPAPHIVYKGF